MEGCTIKEEGRKRRWVVSVRLRREPGDALDEGALRMEGSAELRDERLEVTARKPEAKKSE